MDLTGALGRFAGEVGISGPVSCAGGRTQWHVGGTADRSAREVRAPSGVVSHQPGEMIVRVRAGTTLAELDEATGAGGQFAPIEADRPGEATVGGVLACGQSGPRRLGWGPPRDAVLEVTAVSHRGELVRAGAPLVKNVTGFDLCRLLVGSLGTLGFIAEAVLRCRPRPQVEKWWRGDDVDPFPLAARLYRPLSVLWDGSSTWVGLAGFEADVDAQAAACLNGPFQPVAGPPVAGASSPLGERRSLAPARLRGLPVQVGGRGRWLAEVGVGIVRCDPGAAARIPQVAPDPAVAILHRRLKERFDPAGRLNPGRTTLATPTVAGAP